MPEMGGLAVMLGFYVGVAVLTTVATTQLAAPLYYAALASSLGAGVVGLMDDIFGLRQRVKAFLPLLLAVPLGAVAYASGDVYLLGWNMGLLTFVVVPFGITSAANAANMLEGFNGLGAGMGIIMTSTLIVGGFVEASPDGLYVLFPLLGAMVAFLYFNRYPAKVFPGDSMTLFMGAAIASASILGHQKTFGAILFVPMIAEFGLKARGRFRAENYGVPDDRGRLHYNGKIQSLTHLIMRLRPMKEWQVVATLWIIEAVIGAIVVVMSAVTT